MNNRFFFIANCLLTTVIVLANIPEDIEVPHIFNANTPAFAAEVNKNFEVIYAELNKLRKNTVLQLDEILYRDPDNENKVVLEGVNFHIENGTGETELRNGFGNLIVGYNEDPNAICTVDPYENQDGDDCSADGGTWGSQAFGSHNIIVGKGHNYMSAGGLIVGQNNVTDYLYTVALGNNNFATGLYSVVSGGENNIASGESSSVSGGNSNQAYGKNSNISGGKKNKTGAFDMDDEYIPSSGYAASVSGGENNIASGRNSSVSGGQNNSSFGYWSSVNGGEYNSSFGYWSSVNGGHSNQAYSKDSSISGGTLNKAYGPISSINGGYQNKTGAFDMNNEYIPDSGYAASVSGGSANNASGDYSSVSGGIGNTTSGVYGSVSGGSLNKAYGPISSVSGGSLNKAYGLISSVSGGYQNKTGKFDMNNEYIPDSGYAASVSGGSANNASGDYSSISGGLDVDMGGTKVNDNHNWSAGSLYEDQ